MMREMKNLVAAELTTIGVEFEITPVIKGNLELTGFSFGTGMIRPCVYLESYTERYEDPFVIAMEMYMDAMTHMQDTPINDPGDVLDWEFAKDKIIICVEPHAEGKNYFTCEFVKGIDFFIRVVIKEGDEGIVSTKVTDNLIESWGVEPTEVVKRAKRNTRENATISSMFEVMVLGDKGKRLLGAVEVEADFMYVVSNESKVNGAGIIADNRSLDLVCELLGSYKIAIIPSSIHEIIVVKYDESMIGDMIGMVREVNATEVAPEDVLSEGILVYAYENVLEKAEL